MPAGRLHRALGVLVAATTATCIPFRDDPPDAGPAQGTIDSGDSGPACDPTLPFGAPTLVPGLGDTGATSVEGVRLSADYLVAYFAAGGLPQSAGYHDLYSATRAAPGLPFGNVVPLAGAGINTPGEELDPSVGGDGLTLLWSSGNAGGDPVHIHYATRDLASLPFTGPGLAPTVNDLGSFFDATPFLREDGRVLYFASDRVAANSTDLYRATWTGSAGDAAADSPVPVEGAVNTPFSEVAPVVTPDDLTIFFGSDRNDGDAQGDYDIWTATRASATEDFPAPVNVTELNSSYLDLPTFVTRDRCTLYFSSARSGALLAYVATRGSH